MDPLEYDWSTFSLTFYYNAPREKVFHAWTTAGGLCSFFIEEAQFRRAGKMLADDATVAPGDAYRWRWRHGHAIEGEIVALEQGQSVGFTFGQMRVDVRLRDIDNQTEVHLVQSAISDDADGRVFGHLNCRSCWLYFMTNLQSVLHHGHDLRDQNPDRVSSMEVGFDPLSTVS